MNSEDAGAPSAPTNWPKRILPIAIIALAMGLVFVFDLHHYFSIAALREHRETLTTFVSERGPTAVAAFIGIYALSTALSIPGGAILSIAGGFLFGGLFGGLYVIVGATIGATVLFIAAQSVLGDTLKARAGPWLQKMRAGFQDNALSYLLVLRLIPLVPFFIVNLVPAFLGVRLSTFVLGTFFGIAPGALVFTFTGAGLGSILDSDEAFSAASILTPEVTAALVGMALLSILPVVYKKFRKPLRHHHLSERSLYDRLAVAPITDTVPL